MRTECARNEVSLWRRGDRMERVFKTMRTAGAGSIALGVVVLLTGLTVGVLSIVNGALLLRRKNELTF